MHAHVKIAVGARPEKKRAQAEELVELLGIDPSRLIFNEEVRLCVRAFVGKSNKTRRLIASRIYCRNLGGNIVPVFTEGDEQVLLWSPQQEFMDHCPAEIDYSMLTAETNQNEVTQGRLLPRKAVHVRKTACRALQSIPR